MQRQATKNDIVMLINASHLSYCTNIHAGNNWEEDFAALKKYFPLIKQKVSPDHEMGIGLRISDAASRALVIDNILGDFKQWLRSEGGYIYTINGFPYGNFHNTQVKEDVHSPDWTTEERKDYTLRLFKILSDLLPAEMEGSISTSPLSYRHWHSADDNTLATAKKKATGNILDVIISLIELRRSTGQILHLDIEPEPDGMIETGKEFIDWFEDDLQPSAVPAIMKKFDYTYNTATETLKDHLRLCYDVCHFAIGYENHTTFIEQLLSRGIKVGKIQISSALKAIFPSDINDRGPLIAAFTGFNESTYLHQVIARTANNQLLRYRDMPFALNDYANPDVIEWRAHFHIPISNTLTGLIQSTQDDIVEVLTLNEKLNLTRHLEVETYTWEVLPTDLKIPLEDSISNELLWVIKELK